MKPEETIDFHLRSIWAKVSRAYNTEAQKFGGTMSIGYILLNIDKNGTASTSLGPKMGMEPTSLARSLKKMEERGLIYREKDKTDRRIVKIFLSDDGNKMRKVSKNVVVKFNEAVRENISKEKLIVFQQVIEELNEILDKKKIFK